MVKRYLSFVVVAICDETHKTEKKWAGNAGKRGCTFKCTDSNVDDFKECDRSRSRRWWERNLEKEKALYKSS
jgi:hypothetical protein